MERTASRRPLTSCRTVYTACPLSASLSLSLPVLLLPPLVSAESNNRVVVIAGIHSASPGQQLASFGDSGGALQLSDPDQLVFDSQDNLYVADSGNGRVVVVASLTSSAATPGTPLFSFNASGSLANVNGVSLDAAGNMYVCSSNTGVLVVLAALTAASPGAVLATVVPGFNGNPWCARRAAGGATRTQLASLRSQSVARCLCAQVVSFLVVGRLHWPTVRHWSEQRSRTEQMQRSPAPAAPHSACVAAGQTPATIAPWC